MQIFKFSKEEGHKISNFNSDSAFYSKLMKTEEPTNIGFIHIDKGGIVGYHKAPVPQIFIVVEGEGWVSGDDHKKITLKNYIKKRRGSFLGKRRRAYIR